jgi:hypothetical protein
MHEQIVGTAAVIAFWLFLTIVSVAGILFDYRKKRLTVDTLRLAAERGDKLDPVLLEKLLSHQRESESRENALDPRLLQVGGIITIAAGIGLLPLAVLIAQIAPVALYPITGAGVLAITVGIGLLIAARYLTNNPSPGHRPDRSA